MTAKQVVPRFCWMLVTLLAAGNLAAAQEYSTKNDPQTPVQIVELKSARGSTSLQLLLRNDTGSEILAFVVHGSLTLSDGKKAHSHTVEDYNGLGLSAPTVALPAANTTFSPRMAPNFQPPPGTELVRAEFQVVYVETVDGRVFGSEASKFKSLLDTQRGARRTERARVRGVYQNKGTAALIEDLSQGDPSPSSPGIEAQLLMEWRRATNGERKRLRHILQKGGNTALLAEISKN